MNMFLEKQVEAYYGKAMANLPQDVTGLLNIISQSYSDFEQSIENCKKEKTALEKSIIQEREELCRQQTHLAASQRIANTGSWEMGLTSLTDIYNNPLYWSEETFRILGFMPGEKPVDNALFFSRVHPDDLGLLKGAFKTALETGKVFDLEHRLLLPDGTQKTVHSRSEIIFDENTGKPVKVIGTIQDITAKKKASAQLEKTGRELQALIENMQECFFSVDAETHQLLQISSACENMWGYSANEFMQNPNLWFEVVFEEDKHIIAANYPAMHAGKPFTQVYRVRHRNGSTRWLESKITPTLDSNGKLVRIDGMTADITAEKEAEKTIADNELTNRIFFEQDLAGVYRTTTGGKIISCNQAFATMLGYSSPQELRNVNSVELYFAKEDRDKFINDLKEQKKLRDYNFTLKCKDGSPLYVMENSVVFKDNATGEEYCDGILIDITARIKAETGLYASEKRYRQIVETAQEGIWTIDEFDKTNFVNKKICEILEYTPEEMMGKGLYDFMDEEGKIYAIACMERRRRGSKENLDIRYVTKTGKDVWANISANPIFGDDGAYKGALAMVTDITARKYQEELLQKSEANLRTIVDNTEFSYVLIDAELKIISFNAVAQTVMSQQNDMRLEEGKYLLGYFSPERQPVIKEIISRVMRGEIVSYETSLKQADGPDKWYHVKWLFVPANDEKKWGVILSSNDITESKFAALEREKITADLVQRNKDLQQFNYIVSHNLRAPVANIMGLSSLLAGEGPGEPVNRDLLAGLQTSIKNLDEIIKDLNYILQQKAEGAHEKRETIYLQQLVDGIKLSISNIITKEKAEVNCHFADAESVVAMRSYLYSIFYNLILNSIKYKQPGIAAVINITSIKHKGKTELVFEDNGKGIDLGRHGKDIFGLYKRFDTKVEGKGMGLFMVKTQVENLGGKITVQSKVNKGTTFKLELPA